MMAAGSGHLEVAQLLLDRGADLQTGIFCGQTALMWAAKRGRFEVAQLLLVCGADPGKTRKREDDHFWLDGGTALMDAVDDGNIQVVRLLLNHGADPNQARTGNGRVRAVVDDNFGDDVFVSGCHPETVRLLLERGANPNLATANDAHVPLGCACTHSGIGVIRMLLQFGADPNQASQMNGRHSWQLPWVAFRMMCGCHCTLGQTPIWAAFRLQAQARQATIRWG